jgi:hypothetical protein
VKPISESELEEGNLQPRNATLLTDFWYFLRENKKWWLVPLLLLLLLFGLLTVFAGSPLAPFIYTLF